MHSGSSAKNKDGVVQSWLILGGLLIPSVLSTIPNFEYPPRWLGLDRSVPPAKSPQSARRRTFPEWTIQPSLSACQDDAGCDLRRARYLGVRLLCRCTNSNCRALSRKSLARRWDGTLDVGYSHNRSLQQAAQGVQARSFNVWFAGAAIRRRFSRSMGAFLSYHRIGKCLPT